MGKVLHTPMDILSIYIYYNCENSFPVHTDLEIQVPTVENLVQSDVLHLRPGIGPNVAMHASTIAIYDKLQSFCPLSLCPNYCLYAVTVGVADGGVDDTVNILHLSLSSFFSFCPFVFLSDGVWLTLKPKN